MEPKSKNTNDISEFDNELFDDVDIDIVNEKMEKNLPVLLANKHYMDIDDELLELSMKLNSFLDEHEQALFDKYIETNRKAISYQNCLAYYLGIQYGMKINELK